MTKRFGPERMERWFRERGVELKTEEDGRMFPVTDSSETIVECIRRACVGDGDVVVRTGEKVSGVANDGNRFVVNFSKSMEERFDCIILATGSSSGGHEIASSLGHDIIPPVPSLFTLNAKHQVKEGGVLNGLSGLSVRMAEVTLKVSETGKTPSKTKRKKKRTIKQSGPLLITHRGISGPAPLKLSAFAAREFNSLNYQTETIIHWAPEFGNAEDIELILWQMTNSSPKRAVTSSCPLLSSSSNGMEDGDKYDNYDYDIGDDDDDGYSQQPVIPKRLWSALVLESGFEKGTVWGEAPKKRVAVLARMIAQFVLTVTGRGVFKEEFVTAGGVSLKEIMMKTMESKKCPGLFFCGEVIDVDGVTGGFNFMNCWGTGYVAGMSAVDRIVEG